MKTREYENNGKKTYSFVASGANYIRIHKNSWMEREEEAYSAFKTTLAAALSRIKGECERIVPEYNFKIGLLYNGFTEDKYGEWFRQNEMGFDAIYADSGGLQLLTRGLEVNDETRQRIYQSQAMASHAMSFDDIPAIAHHRASSKTSTKSKVFYPELAKECAIKSAQYVKEQCQFMNEHNADAGVFYITQGNNYNDVYEWFLNGDKVLSKAEWDRICGVSLAFSCLGTGQAEQIENFLAYEKIKQEAGIDKIKNHVHLLGVGSASRLLPTVSYMQSKLASPDSVISYDSTSLSMSLSMGNFLSETGLTKVNGAREARAIFGEVLRFFWDIMVENFNPDFDMETLLNHMVDNRMSTSNAAMIDVTGSKLYHCARLFPALYVFYQVINLQKQKNIVKDKSPIFMELEQCNTLTDFETWYAMYKNRLDSDRVNRHGDSHEITDFF